MRNVSEICLRWQVIEYLVSENNQRRDAHALRPRPKNVARCGYKARYNSTIKREIRNKKRMERGRNSIKRRINFTMESPVPKLNCLYYFAKREIPVKPWNINNSRSCRILY